MDQTPNREYPYPECEPPLVKDSSDIAHLRNLAEAVDEDVQDLYDTAHDVLIRPDGCRMSMASIATTNRIEFPFFTTVTFDTTAGAMGTTALGVMTIPEPGWYMVGTWVDLTSTTYQGLRARFLRSGVPGTAMCPQAQITSTNKQYLQYDSTLFYETPGTLGLEMWSGAAVVSYTYVARIWAQQVIKL